MLYDSLCTGTVQLFACLLKIWMEVYNRQRVLRCQQRDYGGLHASNSANPASGGRYPGPVCVCVWVCVCVCAHARDSVPLTDCSLSNKWQQWRPAGDNGWKSVYRNCGHEWQGFRVDWLLHLMTGVSNTINNS